LLEQLDVVEVRIDAIEVWAVYALSFADVATLLGDNGENTKVFVAVALLERFSLLNIN